MLSAAVPQATRPARLCARPCAMLCHAVRPHLIDCKDLAVCLLHTAQPPQEVPVAIQWQAQAQAENRHAAAPVQSAQAGSGSGADSNCRATIQSIQSRLVRQLRYRKVEGPPIPPLTKISGQQSPAQPVSSIQNVIRGLYRSPRWLHAWMQPVKLYVLPHTRDFCYGLVTYCCM